MWLFIKIILISTLVKRGLADIPIFVGGVLSAVPESTGVIVGGAGNVLEGPITQFDIDEDATLTAPQLVWKYGYSIEIHRATTSDGYILEMHRISGSPQSPPAANKTVVFLQHGLLCTSGNWVLMGPTKGLGYMLADLGYDVWMGNARGNRYSRRHVTYSPDNLSSKANFWNFSWHEIGVIDLAAMIDYALLFTNKAKLHYCGHSQGTTAYFVMTSMKPEYNNKVYVMQALSPVTFMSHVKSPVFQGLGLLTGVGQITTTLLGQDEFAPHNEFFSLAGQVVCENEAIAQAVCSQPLFLLAGYNSEQLNYTMLPVIIGDFPAGCSSKQLLHYGQLVNSAKFCQYDRGLIQNLNKYGKGQPPNYNMTNVKSKVALHYSRNDWLSAVVDVFEHADLLPNLVGKYEVPFAKFNHLDFLWAVDVRTLLYNKVVEIMRAHEY